MNRYLMIARAPGAGETVEYTLRGRSATECLQWIEDHRPGARPINVYRLDPESLDAPLVWTSSD